VAGYDVVAWGGIVAPAKTPAAIVAQLNGAINTIMATAAVREQYAAIGFETLSGPPQRLTERVARETPIWADVVKRSGAQVD
jgi:tripartite-type tricarboxylate transporter receptor subunit TctC